MRRTVIVSLVFSLLLALCLAAPAWAETAVVTGSEVNVRSGPGENYEILGSYKQGSSVEVLDTSNGTWYAVNFYGRTGYMYASFLSLSSGSQAAVISSDNSGYGSGQAVIIGSVDAYAGQPAATPTPFVTVATPVPIPTPSLATYDSLPQTTAAPAATSAPTLANGQNAPTLATGQNAPTPVVSQQTAAGNAGEINAMYVRFRSGPSSETAILGEYNRGKALTILGVEGEWTRCQIDGQTGYVFSQYVTATGAAQTGGIEIQPSVQPTLTPAPTLAAPTLATAEAAGQSAAPAAQTDAQTNAVITGDHVRFRSGPGTGFSILGTYDRGKAVTLLGTQGDWSYCQIDGQTGYVFSQYVQRGTAAQTTAATPAPTLATGTVSTLGGNTVSGNTAGYIKGNNVRFRAAPDSSSQILGELFYGNAVTITSTDGTWTAIVYNGQAGYVYSQYVQTGTYQAVSSGGTATGREIADFALQYVGYSYHWGGKDPSTGFDCSGFTTYVYGHFGYTLNRVAAEQALNGRHVETSELQPGDLLCFYSGSSYIGHVGIYIGNNMFVHAATSSSGVVTSELTGYYASRGFEARRIVG